MLQKYIKNPCQMHGDSLLVGILRVMAQDGMHCEQGGDVVDFGKSFALFCFNSEEVEELIDAEAVTWIIQGTEELTYHEGKYYIGLMIDEFGFASDISLEKYRELEDKYADFCDENPDDITLRESLYTSDGKTYYHDGKVAFVDKGQEWSLKRAYEEWCHKENYWPSIYQVSDHGNVSRVEI